MDGALRGRLAAVVVEQSRQFLMLCRREPRMLGEVPHAPDEILVPANEG